MARFGQQFIRSLTNPTYSRGLFEAAYNLGATPAMYAQNKEQESMMERIKNMTPLETADYMVSQAKTPDQLLRAKQAREQALGGAGQESINTIKSQILAETDPARRKQLEQGMVSVARQTGNDPSLYVGIADKVAAQQAQLKAQEQAKIKAQGIQSINMMKAEMLSETNPERMKQLEQGMIDVAKQTGNDPSSYVNYSSTVSNARATAKAERLEADRKAREQRLSDIEDYTVNYMVANNVTQVPRSIPTPDGKSIDVPSEIISNVQDRIVKKIQSNESFNNAVKGEPLSDEYMAAVNEYKNQDPEGFESNTALQNALKIIEETNGKLPSGRRNEAIKIVKSVVDAVDSKRLQTKRSETAIKGKARDFMETIAGEPDLVYFSNTVSEFLQSAEPTELSSFENQVVQYIKENPSLTVADMLKEDIRKEIIDRAMAGMRSMVSEQDESIQSARRVRAEENTKRAAEIRRKAVEEIMNANNVTAEEAEAAYDDYILQRAASGYGL